MLFLCNLQIKEFDPVDLSPCSTQSKTLASTNAPSHTRKVSIIKTVCILISLQSISQFLSTFFLNGQIKELRGNKNTEANNCMVRYVILLNMKCFITNKMDVIVILF